MEREALVAAEIERCELAGKIDRDGPTSSREWSWRRAQDPDRYERGVRTWIQFARDFIDDPAMEISLRFLDECRKPEVVIRQQWGSMMIEKIAWVRGVVLKDLDDAWRRWRDAEPESGHASVEFERIRKMIGHPSIGTMQHPDGTVRILGKSIPEYVHDRIKGLKERRPHMTIIVKPPAEKGLSIVRKVIEAQSLNSATIGTIAIDDDNEHREIRDEKAPRTL